MADGNVVVRDRINEPVAEEDVMAPPEDVAHVENGEGEVENEERGELEPPQAAPVPQRPQGIPQQQHASFDRDDLERTVLTALASLQPAQQSYIAQQLHLQQQYGLQQPTLHLDRFLASAVQHAQPPPAQPHPLPQQPQPAVMQHHQPQIIPHVDVQNPQLDPSALLASQNFLYALQQYDQLRQRSLVQLSLPREGQFAAILLKYLQQHPEQNIDPAYQRALLQETEFQNNILTWQQQQQPQLQPRPRVFPPNPHPHLPFAHWSNVQVLQWALLEVSDSPEDAAHLIYKSYNGAAILNILRTNGEYRNQGMSFNLFSRLKLAHEEL